MKINNIIIILSLLLLLLPPAFGIQINSNITEVYLDACIFNNTNISSNDSGWLANKTIQCNIPIGGNQVSPEPQTRTTAFCGDNICSETESPRSCAIDCPVNLDELLSGRLLETAWFVRFIIYCFAGVVIFVLLKKQLEIEDRR